MRGTSSYFKEKLLERFLFSLYFICLNCIVRPPQGTLNIQYIESFLSGKFSIHELTDIDQSQEQL